MQADSACHMPHATYVTGDLHSVDGMVCSSGCDITACSIAHLMNLLQFRIFCPMCSSCNFPKHMEQKKESNCDTTPCCLNKRAKKQGYKKPE